MREALSKWCHSGEPFSARIIGGRGGSGKTKLGVEVCRDLTECNWLTGLLTPQLDNSAISALAAVPTARLVVVDYAETRVDSVAGLLPMLRRHATAKFPVRVLLLVRSVQRGDDWRDPFRYQSAELNVLVDDMDVDVLNDVPLTLPERRELFLSSARRFTAFVADPRDVEEAPDYLPEEVYASPLSVTIGALLAVLPIASFEGTGPTIVENDQPSPLTLLFKGLLGHEDAYWRGTPGCDPAPRIRQRLVAYSTLAGADSEEDASTQLRAVPGFEGAQLSEVRDRVTWLNRLYPGPRWWNPVEPDLVGEYLVASNFGDVPGVLAHVLSNRPAPALRHSLQLLARAGRSHSVLSSSITPILSERLTSLVECACREVDEMTEVGSYEATLAAALADAVSVLSLEFDALQAASSLLPPSSASNLTRGLLTVVVHRAFVDACRTSSQATDGAGRATLSSALLDLGAALGESGRMAEALPVCEESVGLERELLEADDTHHLPRLAAALTNHSLVLRALGHREAALAAAQEAVDLIVGADNADLGNQPRNVVISLESLSNSLSLDGRLEEATNAARVAVSMWRDLAATAPAFRANLAGSLNGLAERLRQSRHLDGALEAVDEALNIATELVAQDPSANLDLVAPALSNRAQCLAALSRSDEAREVFGTAVERWRQLVFVNRTKYLPGLAATLRAESALLEEIGNVKLAEESSAEAIAILRDLRAQSPAAYAHLLGFAIVGHVLLLEAAGRKTEVAPWLREATVAIEEALGGDVPGGARPKVVAIRDQLRLLQ